MDEADLKRGLFGYSRKSVQALTSELVLQTAGARQSTREAEAKSAELSTELEAARRQAAESGELIEMSEATAARLQGQLDASDRGRSEADRKIAELETTAGELRSQLEEMRQSSTPDVAVIQEILEATRRAVDELLEKGRRGAEQELIETQAARDGLRSEIDHLVAWREHVMQLAEEVRRSIGDARMHTGTLAGHLEKLAAAPPPVALVAPPEVIRLEEAEPEIEPVTGSAPWGRSDTGA